MCTHGHSRNPPFQLATIRVLVNHKIRLSPDEALFSMVLVTQVEMLRGVNLCEC